MYVMTKKKNFYYNKKKKNKYLKPLSKGNVNGISKIFKSF